MLTRSVLHQKMLKSSSEILSAPPRIFDYIEQPTLQGMIKDISSRARSLDAAKSLVDGLGYEKMVRFAT